MPNKYLEYAERCRQRELHIERLRSIELRRPVSKAAVPVLHKPKRNPAVQLETSLEQRSHSRRMDEINRGTERQRQRHLEHAQVAGRATLSTAAAMRRLQAEVQRETADLQRRYRNTQPRLASPSAIALLTGKPVKGRGGGGTKPAQGQAEDDDESP